MASDKFYAAVPKELGANFSYRVKLTRLCMEDEGIRAQTMEACRKSILFFANVFGFVFEPRKKAVLPFLTYEFQDEALTRIQDCIGKRDLVIPKSRDMGVTWMVIYAYVHAFLFERNVSFMLVSKDEDLVKQLRNPDSLYWKIQFILSRLPEWMIPKGVELVEGTWVNPEGNNTIDGEASTGDAGRGGRRTSDFLDELPTFPTNRQREIIDATMRNTPSRIIVGTPGGDVDEFAAMAQDASSNVMMLHWTQHPEKSRGLYYVDGKPRSAAYDEEEKRPGSSPRSMAREWDINFLGSTHQFFPSFVVENVRKTTVRSPMVIGDLHYDSDTYRPTSFVENPDGRLRLWQNLSIIGSPPKDRIYVVGCDIATGSVDNQKRGASNSVACVCDKTTGEQVAELAISGMNPILFARYAVALCRWFGGYEDDGAYLIWEDNGPGETFRGEILDIGYRNFYWRRNEEKASRPVTEKPGWFSGPEKKRTLLENFCEALRDGNFLLRSADACNELPYYVYLPNNRVGHHGSERGDDPSHARTNHSDRIIAAALCSLAMKTVLQVNKKSETVVEKNTFWARRNERIARERDRLANSW